MLLLHQIVKRCCPNADEESEEDGDYDLTDKFIAADEDEEGEGQVHTAREPLHFDRSCVTMWGSLRLLIHLPTIHT